MSWLLNLFKKIGHFFTSGQAQHDLQLVAEYVGTATQYIEMVQPLLAAINPALGAIPAAILAFEARFPDFFNPKATDDQRKLAALAIATALLQKDFPQLRTSVARAAVQVAYVGKSADAAAKK